MPSIRLSLIAAVCALGLVGCHNGEGDKAFNDKVHAYLLNHPEVLQEVEAKLQAKQQEQNVQHAKVLINQNRSALERDPLDYVANPNGKVTVTEFYDYRCPHCVNMAPTVLSIIHDNPDVRFVFKEFPIFGDASDEAAIGALAVKRNGGDYLGVYRDFMAQKGLDQVRIEQILKAHGVDAASLSTAPYKDDLVKHLTAVKQLAIGLGIEGTPAFIIGDTMIPGEDPDGLRAAVKAARSGKSAS